MHFATQRIEELHAATYMATNDTKIISITVSLADLKRIPMSIDPADEGECRKAEGLVNALWNQWISLFNGTATSQEVMARVAFQFARLYLQAYEENANVDDHLKAFEKKLDELVVKM